MQNVINRSLASTSARIVNKRPGASFEGAGGRRPKEKEKKKQRKKEKKRKKRKKERKKEENYE